MAYSFSCTNAAVAVAGTTFAHGITVAGAATAPTRWWFNHRDVIPAGMAHETLYLTAAPGTVNMIVASSSGATTADVFAEVRHSILS